MSDICAVVVTYNRKQLLKENIEALLNQTYKDFDILIIDNASTDNTYEDIVKQYEGSKLSYINTKKNGGGSGGFNIGLREAIQRNYKFAWIMDDDTIPQLDALKSLVNKANILKNDFSYISSLCKWTDGTIAVMNKQKIHENFFDEYEKIVNNQIILVKSASFVSMFINLEIAKIAGLPYKEFFIYGDDTEYSIRLEKIKKAYLDFNSIVIHKMKENCGVNIIYMNKDRINRCYFMYRNWIFINKKISKKKVIKEILITIVQIKSILLKAKNSKLKRIEIIIRGTIAGFFFNPKIEYIDTK